MNHPTPFPPNSDSGYVERTAPQGKTIVSAQYVAGVGFATVIETAEGKLLEARYPITNPDDVKEITREDFEARYQQPIQPMDPKFGYMQHIRDNVTGDVLTVLGLPGDNLIVGETLEPAYICATAPVTAWEYSDVYPKKIISQKRVERVGAFTLVEEHVGKGDNPAIEHKEVPERRGTTIINAVPRVLEAGMLDRTALAVKFDKNDPDPAATMEELVNAGRQSVSEVATQIKARGMGAPIFHIDDDCSGNGKPINQLVGSPPASHAFLQPVVSDDQAAY